MKKRMYLPNKLDSPVRIIAVGLFALIILSACSNGNDVVSEKHDPKPYPRDGYMGMTYANPNLPTNPTYHSYAKDTRMMTTTLRRIKGIENAQYVINGGTVTVRLQLSEGLSKQQINEVRYEAYSRLTENFPRYSFKLK